MNAILEVPEIAVELTRATEEHLPHIWRIKAEVGDYSLQGTLSDLRPKHGFSPSTYITLNRLRAGSKDPDRFVTVFEPPVVPEEAARKRVIQTFIEFIHLGLVAPVEVSQEG